MAYKYITRLVATAKYSLKCPYAMTPKYVTIHDTANSAPAKNEVSYASTNNYSTGFHIAVDENEAIQMIPFNRNAWHAGDGTNGTGNRQSIGIEICRPTNSDASLYRQAEENAAFVAARLLYTYGLDISRLRKHQDWSKKSCPGRILKEGRWEEFKAKVNQILQQIKSGNCDSDVKSGTTTYKVAVNTQEKQESTTTATSSVAFKVGSNCIYGVTTDSLNVRSKRNASSSVVTSIPKGTTIYVGYVMYTDNKSKPSGTSDSLWGGVTYNGKSGFVNLRYVKPTSKAQSTSYKVKVTADSLNVRAGAGTNYKVVDTVQKGEVFTIVEEKNGWGKLKSGAGWISLEYTKKC